MKRLKGRWGGPTLINRGSIERMKTSMAKTPTPKRCNFDIAAKLRIPTRLKDMRRGLHILFIFLVSLPVILYKPSKDHLGVAATYFAYSGVQLIDNSCGGAILKALDRYVGASFAFMMISPVLVGLILSGRTEAITESWLSWSLVLFATIVAFFWGYVTHLLPQHRSIATTGIGTLAFFTMQTNFGIEDPNLVGKEGYVAQVVKSILGRYTGYFVGLVITVFIWPIRAEYTLMNNLESSLKKMENIMIPLISLDSGIVEDQAIFSNLIHHQLSLDSHNLEYDDFLDIKNNIWSEIEDVYRLIQPNQLLIEAAKIEKYLPIIYFGRRDQNDIDEDEELGLAKPSSNAGWLRRLCRWFKNDCWRFRLRRSKFSYLLYDEALESVRALFYNITSLYLILETHEAVLNDGINDNDHLAWGQTIKVGKNLMTIEKNKNPNIKKYLTEPNLKFFCRTMTQSNFPSGFLVSGVQAGTAPPTRKTEDDYEPRREMDINCRTDVDEEDTLLTEGSGAPLAKSVYDLSTLEVVDMISKTTVSQDCCEEVYMQPLLKWTDDFGPCIGRISKNIAAYINALGNSIANKKPDIRMFQEIE